MSTIDTLQDWRSSFALLYISFCY